MLNTGARLGPYEIVTLPGAGGMGEVHKARDTRLDRTVAIKTLPAEFAADPDVRIRFDRESRAIAALDHPHICAVHDVGVAKLRAPASPISWSGMLRLSTSNPTTAHGTILGTVQYIAPEQVEGRDVDARADIWALGVVLSEMLTACDPSTASRRRA